MFDRHDQKLVIFAFMALFVSYCPLFWGYGVGGFRWPMTLSICLRGMTKNLSFLHFWAVFVSCSPQFWVFRVIFKPRTLSTCPLIVFAFMAVFMSYCPLFGVLGDLHGPWHLVHVCEAWPKTHHFCVLGLFSWAIAHCFGFSRWFTRPMTLTKC
jgi:hypothetical protein